MGGLTTNNIQPEEKEGKHLSGGKYLVKKGGPVFVGGGKGG